MSKAINTNTSEEKEHSEFGGSQAERILNCPGSVILSRGIPNKTNAASERGTAAHACLEYFILNRKKLKNKATRKKVIELAEESSTVGESGETIFWDDEMIEHALHALAWIEEQLSPTSDLYAEQKIDSTKFTTGTEKKKQKSTVDVTIANWSARELIIADYKYGVHPVEAKKNSQLIYYALGVLLKLKGWKKFDRIRCVIIQPRASHKGGTIREWYISVDDAIKWGRKFRKTVKIAMKPKAPLNIGDKWCFFCLAKKICPKMKARMAAKDFDEYIPKKSTNAFRDSKENHMTTATKKPAAKKAAPKKSAKTTADKLKGKSAPKKAVKKAAKKK